MATLTKSSVLKKAVTQKPSNVQTLPEFGSKSDLIWQDYQVVCKINEAKLSKDLSTFFSSMNVYCEVKFTAT
jgi:hypothetical protein